MLKNSKYKVMQLTDLGSIPDQGRIMNVLVFYHELNMILWTLFRKVFGVIIMNATH